jgi:inositol-phosphate transport system substrate-binding protein
MQKEAKMMRFFLRTRVSAVATVLLITSLLLAACPAPAPAGQTAAPADSAAQSSEATGPIQLAVWSMANDVEHWRSDGPAKAAENVTDFEVTVDPVNDNPEWAEYKKKYTLAADAGEAPDIILSGHEDVPVWANAGYVIEFTDCREQYPEFDDVIESLWNSVTWQGKIWGVPQDTEARPMFYNKTKLAEVGWSQEEIDSLPDRIMTGEFTLDDLIATAKAAQDAGVVEPGYGYWHRPTKGFDFYQFYAAYGGRMYDPEADKLVVNREALEQWYAFQRRVVEEGITPENFIGTEFSIWHQTVANGEVLFWNGGIWQWADWAANYVADKGGQEYLFGFAGYALQPSGIQGQPGTTLSHPLVYMISSEEATGKQNQAAACAVLAKTTTAEINTLHAVASTHLGVVKAQADYPDYKNDRLLSETLYMLDYNFYIPNHVMFGVYDQILWDTMVQVENGELSAADGVEQAIQQLQAEVGDVLIVE